MKAENTRTSILKNEVYKNLNEIEKELTDIERLATEYKSPETQRFIEIGRAMDVFFKEIAYRHTIAIGNGGFDVVIANNVEQLLEWYRTQGEPTSE